MKKVLVTSVIALALAGVIGCSNSDSPAGLGTGVDIAQGTLQEHPNLPNQALTSDNMDDFLGSIFGDSFSIDDLLNFTDLPILQKRLAKEAQSSMSIDTTVVMDTTINGSTGSVKVSATVKLKMSGTDDEMTSITVSLQNTSMVFDNFSMNDSIFLAGNIVASANFSMSETSITGSLSAKAGIRFNGLYKGQFTMDLSVSISGNPDSDAAPNITGKLSMDVTSNGSSFTYSQDLSELQNLLDE